MHLLLVALAASALALEEEPPPPPTVWEFLALKYDADADGRISRAEYQRSDETWVRLDSDGNGFLEASEFAGRARRGARRERPAPSERAEQESTVPRPAAPKVGDPAPDFELAVLRRPAPAAAGTEPAQPQRSDRAPLTIKLSGFADKRPVALIFGSYT